MILHCVFFFFEVRKEEQIMERTYQGKSSIREVFSWSIQDVLNRDLYKSKVCLRPFFQVALLSISPSCFSLSILY